MDVFPVNWDSVPEVMNKEQFFRICHISKSTALHLLKSGKVPCEWSGKKTRCYKIRKEDVCLILMISFSSKSWSSLAYFLFGSFNMPRIS